MGLDMYAYKTTKTVRCEKDLADGVELIFRWRKHPDLHGWMEDLYYAKGGNEPSFNCVPVELTADDLDQLEASITGSDLPSTSGFFFGESDGSEVAEDLEFIAIARQALTSGFKVYYDSWW